MSGHRIIVYGKEAREKVIAGVNKLAKTVAVTMGPKGKNVIVQKSIGAPVITKDGVTVARQIVLKDPFEEIGCQLIKEVAGRTVDLAGDGTTTATVLANAIINACIEGLDNNLYSVNDLKKASKLMLKEVVSELNNMTIKVDGYETLRDIAIISANNDVEFGTIIADAFRLADFEGSVMAEALPGVEDSVRQVNGIELKSGYASPGFLKPGQDKIVFNKCAIMIFGDKIESIESNTKLFQEIRDNKFSLLIFAKDYSNEFLANIVSLRTHASMSVCLVKIPTFGFQNLDPEDWTQNLAALTNCTIIGDSSGIPFADAGFASLGYAESVEVSRFSTNIVKPKRNEAIIDSRIVEYNKILSSPSYGELMKSDVKARMEFLKSKTTIITVGYTTELELREKGDRYDDALSAAKAALAEGVVPGGGFALVRAINAALNSQTLLGLNTSESIAAKKYLSALYHPAFTIMGNAGLDANKIIKEFMIKSNDEEYKDNVFFGYNTGTEEFTDLKIAGVIDPKKVTRVAVENATSIAVLMLTTEAVIAEDPDDGAGWQPPAGYRMPSRSGFDHKF